MQDKQCKESFSCGHGYNVFIYFAIHNLLDSKQKIGVACAPMQHACGMDAVCMHAACVPRGSKEPCSMRAACVPHGSRESCSMRAAHMQVHSSCSLHACKLLMSSTHVIVLLSGNCPA